jgi:threonine dehydrogenase-like Zn-dependent dehydrogenase
MLMRALFFDRGRLYFRDDYPVPGPGAGEALIRVKRAGICNTDIEITKGYMGFKGIPGHEFAGVVVGCTKKSLVGKRVTGEINISCGVCSLCRNGLRTHCQNRSVLGIHNKDGAFAEYITLPIRNLHVLPDSVSDNEAVFIEPLAASFEIIKQVRIGTSHSVCVLGDGKLGLLAAQVLSLTNCRLVVAGKHRNKLLILKRRGIRTCKHYDLKDSRFDIIVECTGSPDGFNKALNLVRPRGTIVLKTTTAGRTEIDRNIIVINEINVTGSRCGPFAPAIKAIQENKIVLKPLISRVFPLRDGLNAFKYALKKGVLKVIIAMD